MRHQSFLALASLLLSGSSGAQQAPKFEKVYALKPSEGVFAYARISPDGRYLVYASEMKDPARRGAVSQTVTLVDLSTRATLFTEAGIDAYFSVDGERMIYSGTGGVSIRHMNGAITRSVAPASLGDYYSWGLRDNKNLILTIQSNYYYLDGDKGVMPHKRINACPGMGVGERPLLSKDGKRATTFVRGTVVVRGLDNCDNILDTGLQGAKADFSFDNRYIAFHVPKSGGSEKGYEIVVVDIEQRTMRTITDLPGSSLFPSWTKDGRLCFRYDGDDYRGFLMASNVLSAPARPLSTVSGHVPDQRGWQDVFPETQLPSHRFNMVLVWSTWSAHTPDALRDMQRAESWFRQQRSDVGILTATDPASWPSDVDRMLATHAITLPRIPLAPQRLSLTEAMNQSPTTLLFRDGQLIDRKLGPQTFEDLRDWVQGQERRQKGEKERK